MAIIGGNWCVLNSWRTTSYRINFNNTGEGININSTNGTYNGNALMITFNSSSADHAVVVKGLDTVNGQRVLKYYDPSTGKTGYRNNSDYSSIYECGL